MLPLASMRYALALVVSALLARAAHAAPPVVEGRAERVVAAGPLVAAIVDGRLIIVDERDGRVRAPDDAPVLPSRSAPSDERQFDALGVPDELRDGTDAEDLLEEERTLRERRAPPPPVAPPRATMLAAAPRALWVVSAGGLFRVTGAGLTRLPGAPAVQAIAAGERLAIAAGRSLFVAAEAGGGFRSAVTAAEPITHVAASDDGQIAWATRQGIAWTDGQARHALPVPRAPRDLAFCDGELVVQSEAGLAVATARGWQARHGPLAARRIVCAPGRPWLAVGPGVSLSDDQGRTWRTLPAQATDAAYSQAGLWLATPTGLQAMGAFHGRHEQALPARRPPIWSTLLPRIAVAGVAELAPDRRREVRALVVADFPIGGPAAPAPPAPPAADPDPPVPADAEAPCLVEARQGAAALSLADPGRARSLVARAARAAWLPELRLRVERRLGRREALDFPDGTAGLAGPLGLDTADDVRYEARATWDLSKLVFSAEELAAGAQALRMSDMRRDIEAALNRLYFERRRLLVEPADPEAPRWRRTLRLEEIAAELDTLSGGAFGRCVAAAGPKVTPTKVKQW